MLDAQAQLELFPGKNGQNIRRLLKWYAAAPEAVVTAHDQRGRHRDNGMSDEDDEEAYSTAEA